MKVIVIEEMTIMKTLQVTFEDGLHSRAKEAAHKAKTTLGDFVRAAVEAHVQKAEMVVQENERGGGVE